MGNGRNPSKDNQDVEPARAGQLAGVVGSNLEGGSSKGGEKEEVRCWQFALVDLVADISAYRVGEPVMGAQSGSRVLVLVAEGAAGFVPASVGTTILKARHPGSQLVGRITDVDPGSRRVSVELCLDPSRD